MLRPRGEPVNLAVGGRDRIDPARKEAVDPAQHRILFVHQQRNATPLRC